MFVLLFTYLFGGAVEGSTSRVPRLHPPGRPRTVGVLFTTVYSGIALNTDLTKGVVGPLPVAPRSGARRRSSARCSATAVRYLVCFDGDRRASA